MNKPVTISVGIPAYNEAKSIKRVLTSLLAQKEDGFILKEIIVISDGSTDSMAQKVREIKDKRITFIDDKSRRGKSARLDQMRESGTYSPLAAAIAATTVSTQIQDKTDIRGLSDLISQYGLQSFKNGGIISGPKTGYFAPTVFHGKERITSEDIAKEENKMTQEKLDMLLNVSGEQYKYTRKSWRILDSSSRGEIPLTVTEAV